MSLTTILTPVKPVHKDDAIEMMKNCPRPQCLHPAAEVNLLKQTSEWHIDIRSNPLTILHYCQWFDFGKVDTDTFYEAAEDAHPFLKEGLVQPPYPDTVFRVRAVSHKAPNDVGIEFIMCWENFTGVDRQRLRTEAFSDIPLDQRLSFEHAMTERDNFNRVYTFIVNGPRLDLIAAGMYYGKHWSNIEMKSKKFNFYDGMGDRGALATKIQLALWNMLNTKNIDKRTVTPDAKLQKARTKSGKLPLAVTTYINARHYEAAAQATREMSAARIVGGDAGFGSHDKRRSPRMHLRRAHLRTYKSDGHITPVAAMIINADTESVLRKEYKRKDKGDEVPGRAD